MAYVVSPQFGGFFDFVKDAIPKHTIVGKALSGDYSGAVSGAVKFARPVKTARPAAQSLPKLPTKEPGPFEPGGFVEKNQTILLLAAAGLGAYFILGRKKGRR